MNGTGCRLGYVCVCVHHRELLTNCKLLHGARGRGSLVHLMQLMTRTWKFAQSQGLLVVVPVM